jgi:hypothetical protein
MKKISKLIAFVLFAGLFSQCKVFDNEVLVPGYVYIPGYKFVTNADGSQGDSTSKITEAWVYTQGNLEGSFGFPALIPIQRNGTYEIGLDAGVQRSGQFSERKPNLLITREYFTVNLKPNTVDTIFPVFKYVTGTKFLMIEDFDNVGFRFTKYYSNPGDTIIAVNSGDSARTTGRNSGMIKLSDSTTLFRMISTDAYRLTGLNIPAMLEFDYNTDITLYIGLVANTATGNEVIPLYYAYPNKTWNKVYLDLSLDIGKLPSGTEYKIFIDILRPAGTATPRIFIDNIKLIEG